MLAIVCSPQWSIPRATSDEPPLPGMQVLKSPEVLVERTTLRRGYELLADLCEAIVTHPRFANSIMALILVTGVLVGVQCTR